MAAHKYWRLYITDWNGGSFLSFTELALASSPGGADLCVGGGGSSFFSSQYDTTSNAADNVFDGNLTTKWTAANTTMPALIGYLFPTAQNIVEVRVSGPIAGQATYAPKSFIIQASDDGATWINALSPSAQTGWNNASVETRTFTITNYTLSGTITNSSSLTSFLVAAHDSATGIMDASATVTGSSYSLSMYTNTPHSVTIAPTVNYKWSAGITATIGDFVVSATPDTHPYVWHCTTGGATGGTEPTWNLSGTTTDNAVTWTYVGPLVDPATIGPKIPV